MSSTSMNLQELSAQSLHSLLKCAEEYNVENPQNMRKQDLLYAILRKLSENNITISTTGVLDVLQDGFGFLRFPESNYLPGQNDIYVSNALIKSMGLKTGDTIECNIKPPKENEKYFAIAKITKVNFDTPNAIKRRTNFDNLTPIYTDCQIVLEQDGLPKGEGLTQRVIDLVTPIGRGQRALIVAPPRTGKTVMLKTIAQSITRNFPEIYLMVLLIDERPEEVTDMARSVSGEVISSTFDEPATRHVQVTEMVIEKAKRLVEHKKDVVILLDSITRLARAYNTVIPSSGKVLTGGVDSNALQKPKRFFGAARNIEEGGSLTIIATALVETGSRMDDVIFEEFKGTGNAELILDRKIAERRLFPAIDINKSGTRNEDLLLKDKAKLSKMWILRKILSQMSNVDAIEFLVDKLKHSKSNNDFFESMNN